MMSTIPSSRDACAALDAADPLAGFRARFSLPEELIYLDGNSLGALPADAPARVADAVVGAWGHGLVTSWNAAGWVELPRRLGEKIGRLIGAAPGTVRVCDSTSVNIYKLLTSAIAAQSPRCVIVSERGSFPTDLYIAEGVANAELRLVDCTAALLAALDDERVAVLSLSHVDYRSGALHDMAAITRAAHARGVRVLWDLAHSAGALPVALDACEVDYAVGCGYKYLNGGPGAPAFLYVAERHQADAVTPLQGWFGHRRPFAFEPGYEAAEGIDRFLAGTPPVLSMTALECGLDIAIDADLTLLREKSMALCDLFVALAERRLAGQGFRLASPRDATRRGSQISFAHDAAWPIMQALIAERVVGDFRAPDLLRFGFTPLYTRYVDVWDAVERWAGIMQTGGWREPGFQARNAVT